MCRSAVPNLPGSEESAENVDKILFTPLSNVRLFWHCLSWDPLFISGIMRRSLQNFMQDECGTCGQKLFLTWSNIIVNWPIFTKLTFAEKVCDKDCAEFHEHPTKDSLCHWVTNSFVDGRGLHAWFSVGTCNRLEWSLRARLGVVWLEWEVYSGGNLGFCSGEVQKNGVTSHCASCGKEMQKTLEEQRHAKCCALTVCSASRDKTATCCTLNTGSLWVQFIKLSGYQPPDHFSDMIVSVS